MKTFSVITTFSGCGGSSLGYQMAGGKIHLAVEYDQNAVDTYRLNFPETPIYHRDICNLSVEDCCHLSGVRPRELDILDGSPPCQGFSVAGKRVISDNRNKLFAQFVRLLNGLQPKAFIMENVAGMVQGQMKLVFADCLEALKACGYRVKVRLLNAMYFGVPQFRRRLIFIGFRNDINIEPSFPKAETQPITVGEAWAGLEALNDSPALTPLYQGYWNKAGEGGICGKRNADFRLALNKICPIMVSQAYGPFPSNGAKNYFNGGAKATFNFSRQL